MVRKSYHYHAIVWTSVILGLFGGWVIGARTAKATVDAEEKLETIYVLTNREGVLDNLGMPTVVAAFGVKEDIDRYAKSTKQWRKGEWRVTTAKVRKIESWEWDGKKKKPIL
jgi:hypothetical protein